MRRPGEIDPALVAAEATLVSPALTSGVAAAALGAGGPPVPGAAVSPSSRYSSAQVAVHVDDDGRTIPYLRSRRVPQPEALPAAGWDTVTDADRADLLAARLLGDPALWWRLADANLAFSARDLEVPGRLLRVALPEGFPDGSYG